MTSEHIVETWPKNKRMTFSKSKLEPDNEKVHRWSAALMFIGHNRVTYKNGFRQTSNDPKLTS